MVADVQRVRRRAARSSPQLEYHLLLLVTLGLVAFGLIMVYSASSGTAVVQGLVTEFLDVEAVIRSADPGFFSEP